MYNGQMLQDRFVDMILQKKCNGFFLDIGAGQGGIKGRPINFFSNTYYFESLGWNGIAIDYDKYFISRASEERNCTAICADLTKENITEILSKNNAPQRMDYLSFDVDDATHKVLLDFDCKKYSFNVVTFEHNIYHHDTKPSWSNAKTQSESVELRALSREIFLSHNYELMCADVILDNYGAVEDWYVNKDVLNERTKSMQCSYTNCKDIIKKLSTIA